MVTQKYVRKEQSLLFDLSKAFGFFPSFTAYCLILDLLLIHYIPFFIESERITFSYLRFIQRESISILSGFIINSQIKKIDSLISDYFGYPSMQIYCKS